jgi:hypothetical protein
MTIEKQRENWRRVEGTLGTPKGSFTLNKRTQFYNEFM